MAKKVLIATYSWSGNTQKAADRLAQLIPDADQFKIEVPDKTFSQDMFATSDIAKKQIAAGNYPQLTQPVGDVSQYDLILVGSPVWSASPATPIHTFLQAIKGFNGQVASFYTDAGTPGAYDQNFKKWAAGLNYLGAHSGSRGVEQWVKSLL